MRTGLFFGTFNPVHRGHEALTFSFLSSGRIDKLWIVLTPFPPHKEYAGLASLNDRLEMLNLVFGGKKDVHIIVPEKELPPPHYTIRTLTHIANAYPENQFVLCIGSDTLQAIPDWYQSADIADAAELLVAERPGSSQNIPADMQLFTIHYCNHDAVDISSSRIRKEIAANGNPPSGHLHPAVEEYIFDRRIYLSD